jgi:hypothetical protein
MYRVVHEDPDLSRLDPGLRPVVEAALNKDPAKRPTAQQLLAALVRRPDADSAQVAGTVRLDLSTIGRGASAGALARASRTPDARTRRGLRAALIGAGAVLTVGVLAAAAFLVWGPDSTSGPPPSGEVVYRETFSADNSGWSNDGTSVDTAQGYTGDGRYTMKADSGIGQRWGSAPVNTSLPDHALVSVRVDLSQAGIASWNGVYCEYSSDDQNANDAFYLLEFRGDAYAKVVKVDGGTWIDMTGDIPDPRIGVRGSTLLSAECARGDGEVRLALWAGDQLVTRLVDTKVDRAVGRPRFGLFAEGTGGESRAYFDDFTISRLP